MTFNSQTCLWGLITKICSSVLYKAAHYNQHFGENKTWCIFATPPSTALQMVLLQLRFWSAVKAGEVWREGRLLHKLVLGCFYWIFQIRDQEPCSVSTHLVVWNNRLSSTLRTSGVCLNFLYFLGGKATPLHQEARNSLSDRIGTQTAKQMFLLLEWALQFSCEFFLLLPDSLSAVLC